jgi:hypothetical protein
MAKCDYFIYNNERYVTGDQITCIIDGVEISDAKIYVCSLEEIINSDLKQAVYYAAAYVCQNDIAGSKGPNLLGYNQSWVFAIEPGTKTLTEGVKKLKHLECCKDQLKNIVQLAFPNT